MKQSWKNVRPIFVEANVGRVELSDGSFALIDADAVPLVRDWNWTLWTNKAGDIIVLRRASNPGRWIYLADVICPPPPGKLNDHRSGDARDNRRANLRFASRSQNAANAKRQRTAKSAFKGVQTRGNSHSAAIRADGIRRRLGSFKTAEQAAHAYDAAARESFGEFACTNFPINGERQA